MAAEVGSLNGKLAFAQRRIHSLNTREQALSRELQAAQVWTCVCMMGLRVCQYNSGSCLL